MGDIRNLFSLYGKSPLYQMMVSLLIILGAGILLLIIFVLAGILIFNADISVLQNPSSASGGGDFAFLRYVLIAQDISIFIIPAVIILFLMKPDHQTRIPDLKVPHLKDVALVILLAFFLFPVTSFTGQLNSEMHLPDWLSGVEKWMTEKEDNANSIIDMLIVSRTFLAMMLNLLMIAVLPAIGEELIFRGIFQKIFYKVFRSGHMAVWITAFIFSALHFQFFGFIPRLILGLVFGYIYLWSGTLWLPVISHFVNNAVPVIGSYALGWGIIGTNPDISLLKQMPGLTMPVIIIIAILLYFRNKSKTESVNVLN